MAADRVSQEAVETLYITTAAKARVSQEAVEVLWQFHTVANRVSQLAVEVLQTVTSPTPPPVAHPLYVALGVRAHVNSSRGPRVIPWPA